MAVVEALLAHVAVGNDEGAAPGLAAVIADSTHDVDALVAADVGVAAVPVVGNGEQPSVAHLYNRWNAVEVTWGEIGVKHGHRIGIGFVRGRGDCVAHNYAYYLVHVGNAYFAVAVHVAIDALCAACQREQCCQ